MAGSSSGRLNTAVFRNPVLQVCSFLYLLHIVLRQFFEVDFWFFKNYLNDVLCLPLILGAAIFLQRNVVLRQPAYVLTNWQIGLIVAYISVMFEGIIPFFVSRYTADMLDVLCYALGGWLFWLGGNANGCKLVRRA